MTNAQDIAIFIEDKHDPDRESILDFVLRNFADQTTALMYEALSIVLQRAQIRDEIASLFQIVVAEGGTDHELLANVIKRRRKEQYEPELETILARRWRCPHCKQYTTIQKGVLIAIGEPKIMPKCAICNEEGIAPIYPEVPDLETVAGGKP